LHSSLLELDFTVPVSAQSECSKRIEPSSYFWWGYLLGLGACFGHGSGCWRGTAAALRST